MLGRVGLYFVTAMLVLSLSCREFILCGAAFLCRAEDKLLVLLSVSEIMLEDGIYIARTARNVV